MDRLTFYELQAETEKQHQVARELLAERRAFAASMAETVARSQQALARSRTLLHRATEQAREQAQAAGRLRA